MIRISLSFELNCAIKFKNLFWSFFIISAFKESSFNYIYRKVQKSTQRKRYLIDKSISVLLIFLKELIHVWSKSKPWICHQYSTKEWMIASYVKNQDLKINPQQLFLTSFQPKRNCNFIFQWTSFLFSWKCMKKLFSCRII